MGLDVSVYKNIQLSNEKDSNVYVYVPSEEFADRIKNFIPDAFYKGKETYNGVSYAYSTHNRFREYIVGEILCRKDLLQEPDEKGVARIDYEKLEKETDLPFFEFINFSDCEGCIDWETSNKLYLDFTNYSKVVEQHDVDHWYMDEYYNIWLQTFKEASEPYSVVVFH